MIVHEFLSSTLFPLKKTDTCEKALELLNEFCISDLPVVDGETVLGYVNSFDLVDAPDPSEPIEPLITKDLITHIRANQHFLELIALFGSNKLTTMSVVDDANNYMGIVSLKEFIKKLSETNTFLEVGSIIQLQINVREYSLAEISRIVESNDARILGVFISSVKNTQLLNVSLKLNTTNLKSIIATFERFGYNNVSSFLREDTLNYLQDRYNLLMKYLNM